MVSQKTKYLGIVLTLFLLLLFYKCPFQFITGIPCPGCNMKTSLYYLLKGNIQLSLYYHALLIPTIMCGVLCLLKPKKTKMILIIWCTLMIAYYIYRMILYFPNSPMIYSKNNLIYLLFRHA